MVARIAEAISLGLTDEEASALVHIHWEIRLEWKKDPEFSEAIKSAVAARMVKRLKQIETGANGWQGCAWLTERLYPTRYAKPEVLLVLPPGSHSSPPTYHNKSCSSLTRAKTRLFFSSREGAVSRSLSHAVWAAFTFSNASLGKIKRTAE
jgi:hypothetical protein